jgi:hypothetical protein
MHIITSHFNEDLRWLEGQTVHVVGKEGEAPLNIQPESHDTIPNIAHEASSYLHFLHKNYHHLPERMAFIHGHEHAEHQKIPILQAIETFKHEHLEDLNRKLNAHLIVPDEYHELWGKLFDTTKPAPKYVNYKVGAQFILSREAAHNRTQDFYGKALEKLLNIDPKQSKTAASFYEAFWHTFLGREFPTKDKSRPNAFQVDDKIFVENPEDDYADMFLDKEFNVCGPCEFMKKLAEA